MRLHCELEGMADLKWEFSMLWHMKKTLRVKIWSGGEEFRKDSLFSLAWTDSRRLVQIPHFQDKARGRAGDKVRTDKDNHTANYSLLSIIPWPLRKIFLHFLFMGKWHVPSLLCSPLDTVIRG
jgi:hypothetical protein